MLRAILLLAALLMAAPAGAQPPDEDIPELTGPRPIDRPAAQSRIADPVTDAGRQARAWPEQPPIIPHAIDRYELSINANNCLGCHRRQHVSETGAPMISISHFLDRDGQMLADVAPRRYFCTQCHVQQTDAAPLVDSTFIDMDRLIREGQ